MSKWKYIYPTDKVYKRFHWQNLNLVHMVSYVMQCEEQVLENISLHFQIHMQANPTFKFLSRTQNIPLEKSIVSCARPFKGFRPTQLMQNRKKTKLQHRFKHISELYKSPRNILSNKEYHCNDAFTSHINSNIAHWKIRKWLVFGFVKLN